MSETTKHERFRAFRGLRSTILALFAVGILLTLSFFYAPTVFGITLIVACALVTIKLIALTTANISGTFAPSLARLPKWLRTPLSRR